MNYDELTLDWDYYMLNMLTKHKTKIIKLIQNTCKTITLLETQKGVNVIATFNGERPLNELLVFRLFLFDDIFRLRNEADKVLDGQEHRVNRIWLEKDGYKKKYIMENEPIEKFNEYEMNGVLSLLINKKKIAQAEALAKKKVKNEDKV